MIRQWAAVAFLALAGCSDRVLPMDAREGERGRVVRLLDGDTFVLDGGQVVRLVGLEAPSFGRDGAPDQPFAEASRRALETLVLGRQVQLFYPGMTRDRYGRALAQVVVTTESGRRLWVNGALLEAGTVRHRAYADTAAGHDVHVALEAKARGRGLGLWALPEARPLGFERMGEATGQFVVLVGTLTTASRTEEGHCAVEGQGADRPFLLRFENAGPCEDFSAYGKRPVELRGYLGTYDLLVDHSSHVIVTSLQ